MIDGLSCKSTIEGRGISSKWSSVHANIMTINSIFYQERDILVVRYFCTFNLQHMPYFIAQVLKCLCKIHWVVFRVTCRQAFDWCRVDGISRFSKVWCWCIFVACFMVIISISGLDLGPIWNNFLPRYHLMKSSEGLSWYFHILKVKV